MATYDNAWLATAQNDVGETEQLFKYILKPPLTTSSSNNTKQTSGGWPVTGRSALTGPHAAQLPCPQQSVNSSAQTNSQSSGVAGQAGEHVCLCMRVYGERMIVGLQQAKLRGIKGSSG